MAANLVIANFGFAACLGYQAAEHPHRGGFSCAVGSEEAEDFALVHAEGQVVDGNEVAELPRKVLSLDRAKPPLNAS